MLHQFPKLSISSALFDWRYQLQASSDRTNQIIAGFLLITGLCRKQAMSILALDLLIVSFGHGFMSLFGILAM